MSLDEPELTPTLQNWNDVQPPSKSSGLLLGNGASRVVWEAFGYPSLLEQAKNLPLSDAINLLDQKLFEEFNTKNFEMILFALKTANKVMGTLGNDDPELAVAYARIRNALVKAVHGVHIKFGDVPRSTLSTIGEELRRYSTVYSTNYDLLTYWAMKNVGFEYFTDFFLNQEHCFDPINTKVDSRRTRVLFVHGALHFYVEGRGKTYKMIAHEKTLLERFSSMSSIPLFVSEGESNDKLSTINDSQYLTFAYQSLSRHSGSLVIFGQGLGESDAHLVTAINQASVTRFVIGIHSDNPADTIKAKAHYYDLFPEKKLIFFKSETHPLGNPTLNVRPKS